MQPSASRRLRQRRPQRGDGWRWSGALRHWLTCIPNVPAPIHVNEVIALEQKRLIPFLGESIGEGTAEMGSRRRVTLAILDASTPRHLHLSDSDPMLICPPSCGQSVFAGSDTLGRLGDPSRGMISLSRRSIRNFLCHRCRQRPSRPAPAARNRRSAGTRRPCHKSQQRPGRAGLIGALRPRSSGKTLIFPMA